MLDRHVSSWRAAAALAGVLLIFTASHAAPAPAVAAQALRIDQAELALQTLARVQSHGLDPASFPAGDLSALLHASDPAQQARGQDLLRSAVLSYASAQHGGRIDRGQFPFNWAIRPAPYDASADLDQALAQDRFAGWLDGLAPPFEGYTRLVAARDRYAAIVAAGGWTAIATGPSLKLGATGPRVEALRQRLLVEDPATPPAFFGPEPQTPAKPARAKRGHAAAIPSPPAQPAEPPVPPPPPPQVQIYDQPLADAVARAQARYGLNVDGAAGASTLAALNVPAVRRLMQIDVNLERWRWFPRTLPPDRLEVNIAAATMETYQGDQVVLSMRAIVGRMKGQTPSFRAKVETVIFDPPWNVPPTIAAKEIWPKERRHPGYLARERIIVESDGTLQQRPGPKNALGLVKFDLPNPFTVYLHDTPSRRLFAKEVRTLSHGCMRLERPYDLAKLLLKNDPDWPEAKIEAALHGGQTIRVPLARSVPVFVIYRSAFVDAQGQMNFRSDVYGWDDRLQGLLAWPRPLAANSTTADGTKCAVG